jgi:hypothetical protein
MRHGQRLRAWLAPVALALTAAWAALPAPAAAGEIGPEDDFCAAANALPPGGELVLRPGDYQGPCTIHRGGTPGAPVVIRAADLHHRPHIVYTGRQANVVDVKADHVTIRGLALGPTSRDADGIRVFSRAGVTIEDCAFNEVGGIAVAATHNSIRGLVVRRNTIENSGSTGMYFGCHEGVQCVVSGLVVERNFIRTIRAPDPEIGYGLQVKLNSSGVIRDNVILDTKGPGIMVYGSWDLLSRSVVERNFVMGSLTSAGIVVGGGPALVRNNISVHNRGAGIGLEDYHGRGLLRSIVISHNTLYRNGEGGVSMAPEARARDVAIVNNAVQTRQGAATVPKGRVDVDLVGNVDCTWALCFANPETMDFSPVEGSLLRGPAGMRGLDWVPPDDYFGARRTVPPVLGAIQTGGGPIGMGPKP